MNTGAQISPGMDAPRTVEVLRKKLEQEQDGAIRE
jgi:hypothetical protein